MKKEVDVSQYRIGQKVLITDLSQYVENFLKGYELPLKGEIVEIVGGCLPMVYVDITWEHRELKQRWGYDRIELYLWQVEPLKGDTWYRQEDMLKAYNAGKSGDEKETFSNEYYNTFEGFMKREYGKE